MDDHPEFDICACADFRHQHENGTGACRVCAYSNPSFLPQCKEFRFHSKCSAEEVERLKNLEMLCGKLRESTSQDQ